MDCRDDRYKFIAPYCFPVAFERSVQFFSVSPRMLSALFRVSEDPEVQVHLVASAAHSLLFDELAHRDWIPTAAVDDTFYSCLEGTIHDMTGDHFYRQNPASAHRWTCRIALRLPLSLSVDEPALFLTVPAHKYRTSASFE